MRILPNIAYILTGRGCGLENGRVSTCTFCIWQHALWNKTARLRSPENVVGEIEHLISIGAKEVFDGDGLVAPPILGFEVFDGLDDAYYVVHVRAALYTRFGRF